MKTYLVFLIVAFALGLHAKNNVKEAPYYGKEIESKKALKLDKVLKEFSHYENKEVVMEANVKKVCAKKGCWMTLQGDQDTFRVKFHEYSYFVPISLIGKKVWVEGQVSRKKLSISDTRHYLEDGGASQSVIESVDSPSYEYHIIAKGVKVVK